MDRLIELDSLENIKERLSIGHDTMSEDEWSECVLWLISEVEDLRFGNYPEGKRCHFKMGTCESCKSKRPGTRCCAQGIAILDTNDSKPYHPRADFLCSFYEAVPKPIEFEGVISDYGDTWLKVRSVNRIPMGMLGANEKVKVTLVPVA